MIVIVGALAALLLPAVQTARESARKTVCENNLRQLGLALLGYESTQRRFPVGCLECRADVQQPRFTSWVVFLLPHIEQDSVFTSIDLGQPMWQSANAATGGIVLPELLCPSSPSENLTQASGLWRNRAFTDYGGLYGVEGVGNESQGLTGSQTLADRFLGVMLYEQATRLIDIKDGTSRTAVIGEMLLRRSTECEWINGHHIFAQEKQTPVNGHSGLGNDIGSPHPGGALVSFCDGHVEWFSDSMEQSVFLGTLTRAGGELRGGK